MDKRPQRLAKNKTDLMPKNASCKRWDTPDILLFHRALPPIRAQRMNWHRFPLLAQRQAIAPPGLPVLPRLAEQSPDTGGQTPVPLTAWHVASDLFRQRRPYPSLNGLRKKRP